MGLLSGETAPSPYSMSLFIASVVGGVHIVLIFMTIGPSLRSVVGRHIQYEPHPGHERATEREGRWYPQRLILLLAKQR